MKKILLYTPAFIFLLFFAACNKYLDVTPLGKVVPTTYKDFSEELGEAYSAYSVNLNKSFASYRSDEVTARNGRFGDIRNQYTWDENGTESTSGYFLWDKPYKVIFYTNHVIESIAKIKDAGQQKKNQLEGEARLLRALTYFDLVNIFGKQYNETTSAGDKAVPLITSVDLEAVQGRNTVDEVYKQILGDLTKGLELINVEQFSVDSSYKFSKLSAHALSARIYLYMNNWQKAIDHAKSVLSGKPGLVNLNTDKKLPNLHNSVETIMPGAFYYSSVSAFFVSENLIQKYDTVNDLRFRLYYKYEASGTTVLKSGSNKFACTFRIAEQYLNLAEAYAQLKNNSEAKKYLNLLKKNRLTPAFYTAEEARINRLGGTQLLNEIYDERARELAFEGHRWFDLKRTTQPTITHKATINNAEVIFTLAQGDARYTAKIPLDATKANPRLLE